MKISMRCSRRRRNMTEKGKYEKCLKREKKEVSAKM
jgi:hypothetical protein